VKRVVLPEILDELDGSDPRAIRSRRDLRLVNFFMGNERWICRCIQSMARPSWTVSELGAGGGELLARLAGEGRSAVGYDFQPKPSTLPNSVSWRAGDFLTTLSNDSSEVVVGSLILHHFQDEELALLGDYLKNKKSVIFAEPLRASFALAEGYLLWPLVGEVTRHDMMVSIRAGFQPGELPQKLGLVEGWEWQESVTICGGLRSIGTRALVESPSSR